MIKLIVSGRQGGTSYRMRKQIVEDLENGLIVGVIGYTKESIIYPDRRNLIFISATLLEGIKVDRLYIRNFEKITKLNIDKIKHISNDIICEYNSYVKIDKRKFDLARYMKYKPEIKLEDIEVIMKVYDDFEEFREMLDNPIIDRDVVFIIEDNSYEYTKRFKLQEEYTDEVLNVDTLSGVVFK